MTQLSALQLSEYILTNYPDKKITPMKLQKLAYYVKVWTLVAGFPKIDAPFYAWKYGPVNKAIYYSYEQFKGKTIPSPNNIASYPPEISQQLNFILDNYVDYSAFALSAMTHQEAPWAESEKNAEISEQAIIEFYSQQSFAKNFASTPNANGRFYPVKDNLWHSFVMDMSEEEAAEFESYPSYQVYRQQKRQAELEFQAFFNTQFNVSNY